MLTRLAALAGSTAIAAGILAAVSAGPAAAQVPYTGNMYLANDMAYGTYSASGVTSGSPIEVKKAPVGLWLYNENGTETIGSVTGTAFEIQAVYSSGKVSPYCLADTGPDANAHLASCGANGTVFIGEENGDGIIYYSRYLYDQGNGYWVLTVYAPSTNAPVFTYPEASLGGNYFGRWTPPEIIG